MLEYSANAKYAKSVFFEDLNSIDIFVEDTTKGYIKLYTNILSRVFSKKYNIHCVFPLGGRKEILEKWAIHKVSNRPFIYIYDGDLDILYSKPLKGKGLYCHGKYCIENFLIEEKAIVNMIDEDDTKIDRAEIMKRICFKKWIKNNNDLFYDLYTTYATSKTICPEIQTVAYSINLLISSNTGNLDRMKVKKRIAEVKKQLISKIGRSNFYSEYNKIKMANPNTKDFMLSHVSGKDHLFPLILMKMRSITCIRRENRQIINYLSIKVNPSNLKNITRYVYKPK